MAYENPNWHVMERTGIPVPLRALLLEDDAVLERWQSHPAWLTSGVTLYDFHRRLREATSQLEADMQILLDEAPSDLSEQPRWRRAYGAGPRLIAAAHSHHHAEDTLYFPAWQASYPQLARPLAMLDSDHRVIEEALDTVENGLHGLDAGKPTKAVIGRTHAAIKRLSQLLNRHLDDEEEIVMPAILGVAVSSRGSAA